MENKRGWHKGSVIDLTEELMSHCSQKGLTMQLRKLKYFSSKINKPLEDSAPTPSP